MQTQLLAQLPEALLPQAVSLFEQAFAEKTSLAIPDDAKRRDLMLQSFLPEHALCVVDERGETLLGLLALKSRQFAFTGGISYLRLIQELGIFSGNRAAFVFALFDRSLREDELVVEFLAVDAAGRGQGIGTQLLKAARLRAQETGFQALSLEVINTNQGARRLYERFGFREVKTEYVEPLEGWLGFESVTVMELDL